MKEALEEIVTLCQTFEDGESPMGAGDFLERIREIAEAALPDPDFDEQKEKA